MIVIVAFVFVVEIAFFVMLLAALMHLLDKAFCALTDFWRKKVGRTVGCPGTTDRPDAGAPRDEFRE